MSIDLHEPVAAVRAVARTAVDQASDLTPVVDVGRIARRLDRRVSVLVLVVLGLVGVAGIAVAARRRSSGRRAVAPDPFGVGVEATGDLGGLGHVPAAHG